MKKYILILAGLLFAANVYAETIYLRTHYGHRDLTIGTKLPATIKQIKEKLEDKYGMDPKTVTILPVDLIASVSDIKKGIIQTSTKEDPLRVNFAPQSLELFIDGQFQLLSSMLKDPSKYQQPKVKAQFESDFSNIMKLYEKRGFRGRRSIFTKSDVEETIKKLKEVVGTSLRFTEQLSKGEVIRGGIHGFVKGQIFRMNEIMKKVEGNPLQNKQQRYVALIFRDLYQKLFDYLDQQKQAA
jgi:hypothetical protein